jgi:hypothetical protein
VLLLKLCPIRVGAVVIASHSHLFSVPHLTYLYDVTVMEDIITDEVESILYIAREISGMSYFPPHDAPM